MKILIVRCEDHARSAAEAYPLMDGARAQQLNELVQAGAGGRLELRRAEAQSRLELFRGLLGIPDSDFGAGRWYAAAAGAECEPGARLWCCDLVTQEAGSIRDARAGGISTKESAVLIQALDEQLGSDTRRWEVGEGSHHILVVNDRALDMEKPGEILPPEQLVGKPWNKALPKGQAGEALELLVEQAAKLLEKHPVNNVRIDLQENPANMAWIWGGAAMVSPQSFKERTGLKGAIISGEYALRGAAKLYGMDWQPAPECLDDTGVDGLAKAAQGLFDTCDVVFAHVSIPDEDRVDRACLMSRLDQRFVRPVCRGLGDAAGWRFLWLCDNGMGSAIPFVAYGGGLPEHPLAQPSQEHFEKSKLAFNKASDLWRWMVQA